MPTTPSRLPVRRLPSMKVGAQPFHSPDGITAAPATTRRDTDRISAIVMSAVSSVSTPGVLVTTMPRRCAASTSMLSVPVPKLAMSFSSGPAAAIRAASMRSVTVGTRTWASAIAAARSAADSGLSSLLSRASKSSRMRVSMRSGNFRVTTTRGLRAMALTLRSDQSRVAGRGFTPPSVASS